MKIRLTFEEATIALLGATIATTFALGAHELRHSHLLPYLLLCASVLFGTAAALGVFLVIKDRQGS